MPTRNPGRNLQTFSDPRWVGYIASMPAYCRPAAYAAFAVEVPRIDTTLGLFRAAFAIARHEQPDADVERAEETIKELASTVSHRVHSTSVEARMAHLHD